MSPRRSSVDGAPPAGVLDQVPAEVRAMSVDELRDAVTGGLCVGQVSADDDEWHPVAERATDTTRAAARRACRGCRVQAECLELALRTRETNGVWGGLLAEDRTRIAQSRGHATAAGDRAGAGLVRSA